MVSCCDRQTLSGMNEWSVDKYVSGQKQGVARSKRETEIIESSLPWGVYEEAIAAVV